MQQPLKIVGLLILLCLPTVIAGNSTQAVLAKGVGARAYSLSNMHLASSPNADSGYWNPAALPFIRYPEVAMMSGKLIDVGQYGYGGYVDTLFDGFFGFGMTVIASTVSGIPEANRSGQLTGNHFSDSIMVHLLSMGIDIGRFPLLNTLPVSQIGLGLSQVNISQTLHKNQAAFSGMNVSGYVKVDDQWSLAASIQNIGQSALIWNTASKRSEILPRRVQLGVAYHSSGLPISLYIDGVKIQNRQGFIGSGLEAKLIDSETIGLWIRGGMTNHEKSAGIGIQLQEAFLDYAIKLSAERYQESIHWVTIRYGFK